MPEKAASNQRSRNAGAHDGVAVVQHLVAEIVLVIADKIPNRRPQ